MDNYSNYSFYDNFPPEEDIDIEEIDLSDVEEDYDNN